MGLHAPHYHCFLQRLKTFTNWSRVPSAESLARVGFFRINTGVDDVQCFYCGIRIYDWEPHDDPLSEHLRCSDNCRYANFIKHLRATVDLFTQTIKLFEEVATFGGVDVAGNNCEGKTKCYCYS